MQPATRPDVGRFAIGFDDRDRERLHALWDEVIDSQQWAHGPMTARFEAAWQAWNGLPAVAMSGWGGGALAALEFAGVRGRGRALPVQHLHGHAARDPARGRAPRVRGLQPGRPLHVVRGLRGARPSASRPRACVLVHIGGHIAFDVQRIAALLPGARHLPARGLRPRSRRLVARPPPGTYGDAGVYSLYATKTISTGEGGVLVSRDPDLLDFARSFRDYGKPDHEVEGSNFRMSEFTAALGLVQIERLEEIVAWKNEVARTHAR